MHMNKNGHFLRKNETDIKSNHNGYTHTHTHTDTHAYICIDEKEKKVIVNKQY